MAPGLIVVTPLLVVCVWTVGLASTVSVTSMNAMTSVCSSSANLPTQSATTTRAATGVSVNQDTPKTAMERVKVTTV